VFDMIEHRSVELIPFAANVSRSRGVDAATRIRILDGSMHRAYELGLKQNLNSIQVDFARTSAC
jgi:hypothetical protein